MGNFLGIERLTLGPWQALERAVLRLYEHCGFRDCRLVGGTGDQGADILSVKEGRLWVTQVKYRRASVPLDDSAVKEVVRAIGVYSANEGVVATNQYFQPEVLRTARKFSDEIRVPIRLWSGDVLLNWSKRMPEFPLSRKELRPYQEEAVEAVDSARSQGTRRGLLVMATGLGKTRVAAEIVLRELLARPGKEVLILAHTVDLAHQLEKALWEVLPRDISTHLWAAGERPAYPGGVVCATMQSVLEAARVEPLTNRFSIVVVDEAHHAPAHSYSELLAFLRPNFLLGMTATPWRSDERLLSDMFGPPLFTMSIIEGMQQGYLARVDYRMLVDDIDWDEVRSLSKQKLTVTELNRRLFLPQRDESIVAKLLEHMGSIDEPRCIIFSRTIEHATTIHKLLRASGKASKLVHSELDRVDSANALRDFRSGRVPILISVDMLNEGIDVPDVNLIVFLRVTHSRRIFVQQLGRGLRLTESKKSVRVLDFVADVRRVAAGMRLNREASDYVSRTSFREALRFPDGRVVQFSNDKALSFFEEYLRDIAEVEDLDEGSRLKFPSDVIVPDEM